MMRIAIDPTQTRLAVLCGDTLKLYDIDGAAPREIAARAVPEGHWVAGCDAFVAVLTGQVAPAGASLEAAMVVRFGWDGSELGPLAVGEVDRRGLSFDAAGKWLVVTDWSSCRVTLLDGDGGARIGAAGRGIPSGASIRPDGQVIIAGSADQGSGDILLFDATNIAAGTLPMEILPEPAPCPGLDDAPYFSVWAPGGTLAALSNQTWGGRGVFVYDTGAKRPRWSLCLEDEEETDSEDWYPQPMAFTEDSALLLVAEAGAIRAHRAEDGEDLGGVSVANGDGQMGFAVQTSKRRVWLPGPVPVACEFGERWR